MKKFFDHLKSIWLNISTPSPQITDQIEREKAWLILILLTGVLPIGIVASLLFPFTTGNRTFDADHDSLFVIYSLGGWAIIYLLARSRFYKISIWLSLLTAMTIIFFSAVPDRDFEDFFYLVLVIMVSGLFFSLREIMYIYLLCLLGTSSMVFVHPGSIWDGFFYPASIVTIGGLVSIIGSHYLRNISAIHYKQELLHEAQFRRLLESTHDGLAEIKDGKFVRVDNSFARLFGIPPEDFIGKPMTDVLSQQREKDRENRIFETVGRTASKDTLHLEVLHSSFSTADSDNQVIAVRNITKRKIAEAELKKQALYDPVTNLYNRTQLLKHVTSRRASPRENMKTSLLFLDLDNFKTINDHYGHEKGDGVLKAVGKRLENALRDEDIVARYGGDEFVIVYDYTVDESYTIAQRILSIVQEPISLNGVLFALTTSIGIVRDISNYADVDAVLRAADEAMYHAKNRGKNQFKFAPSEVIDTDTP